LHGHLRHRARPPLTDPTHTSPYQARPATKSGRTWACATMGGSLSLLAKTRYAASQLSSPSRPNYGLSGTVGAQTRPSHLVPELHSFDRSIGGTPVYSEGGS